MEAKTYKLTTITRDERLQVRAGMDSGAVERYAEQYREGESLPPLHVFIVGGDVLLVDGFHRYLAAESAGLTEVEAVVHKGGFTDALRFAIEANQKHGLPLTNADKRRALDSALDSSLTSGMSVREIARLCGVSKSMVDAEIRRRATPEPEVSTVDTEPPSEPAKADPPPAKVSTVDTSEGIPPEDDGPVINIESMRTPFIDADRSLGGVTLYVKEILATPAGAVLAPTAPEHLRQLKEVAESLRSCRPEAVCTNCNGAGCTHCASRGWLPKAVVDSRKQAAKAKAVSI